METQEDLLLRAQAVIRDLRAKLAASEQPAREQIAIVGMACRFPGEAVDVSSFWNMSIAGRTAAADVPATRWTPKKLGKGALRANLVDDLLGLDADFFDISPREALQMDPTQRMFLEVAWHALENAGLPREKLAGSATGVFVGQTGFSEFLMNRLAEGECDSFAATGNSADVLAGRLSYLLDLHGPCAVVNTGCSSSLVAMHMARRSLLANECSTAVVGGVNVVGPLAFDLAEDLNLFAADGLCKTFDARANGFGRGEGCGVIVMKRLSDALADHDHIWSVVRGSATNQDGRTNGLTAPNGLAQTAVVRQALKDARLTASQIGYVETHGTGTVIGDPIEVEALSTAFKFEDRTGHARSDGAYCALGTAKGNVGHLEGAAGIAGIIRAVSAIEHRTIPPLAGFQSLNPHVKLEGTPFYIPTRAVPWHEAGNLRYAGISSFGWSGTNAHVVLAEAPVDELTARDLAAQNFLIPVSSATQEGLRWMLHGMAEVFEGCDDRDLGALAWSAGARRTHHAHRIAVVGGSGREIAEALRQRAQQLAVGSRRPSNRSKFFLGKGFADARSMFATLIRESPEFRRAVQVQTKALDGIGNPVHLHVTDAEKLSPLEVLSRLRHGIAEVLKEWGANWSFDVSRESISNADADVWLSLREGSADLEAPDRMIGALREGESPVRWLLRLAGASFEAGGDVRWEKLPAIERRMIPLPAYKFRRYDIERSVDTLPATGAEKQRCVDDWFHEVSWQERSPAFEGQFEGRGPASAAGDWLLFADQGGFADEFASLLSERGGRATLVRPGKHFEQTDRSLFVADPKDAEQVGRLLSVAESASSGPLKVLFFGALASVAKKDPVARAIDLLMQVAGICKALSTHSRRNARLWLITRGAQQVNREDGGGSWAQASLWGLNAVAALEQAPHWRGILDLGIKPSQSDAALLFRECMEDDGEQRVCYRDGKRFVARFLPVKAPAPKEIEFNPDTVYLITGAFGGIGLELAQWLVDRGARQLVLVSRSGLPELSNESACTPAHQRALQSIGRWRDGGADVHVEAADVADSDCMRGIFASRGTVAWGIFHAAGDLVWKPLAEQTATEIERSFHAKVQGALVLDELTRDVPLDFFVFFSSAAASVGAVGGASYASANAFVDALVDQRSAEGRRFLSVQWGYWERKEVRNSAAEDQFRRSGFSPMPAAGALNALGRVMESGAARSIVADIDLERLGAAFNLRGTCRFVEASLQAPESGPQPKPENETALIKILRPLDRSAQIETIRQWICREIRALCGWPLHSLIDQDRGFFDMGMTSLTSLELRRSLVSTIGCKLPGTATLLYPNVNALADFVHGELFGRPEAAQENATPKMEQRELEVLTDEQTRSALRAELQLFSGSE